jgi:hypothetical protein
MAAMLAQLGSRGAVQVCTRRALRAHRATHHDVYAHTRACARTTPGCAVRCPQQAVSKLGPAGTAAATLTVPGPQLGADLFRGLGDSLAAGLLAGLGPAFVGSLLCAGGTAGAAGLLRGMTPPCECACGSVSVCLLRACCAPRRAVPPGRAPVHTPPVCARPLQLRGLPKRLRVHALPACPAPQWLRACFSRLALTSLARCSSPWSQSLQV